LSNVLPGTGTEDVVYAVTVNRTAQLRLCDAAQTTPIPDWRDEATAEPDLLEMTRQLTGLEFRDLVNSDEILRRDPYICGVCGGTFTLAEFRRVRGRTRSSRLPNPFAAGHPVHIGCGEGNL
jgi:hypothetical protein